MWIRIIIVIIIVAIVIAIRNKSNRSSTPLGEDTAERLFGYYQRIRDDYIDEDSKRTIIIGSPVVEYNGTLVMSGFLSVSVREDDGSKSGLAQSLGMSTKIVQGKYVHEFVIKQRFSKSNKIAIIETVARKIEETYPNDLLKWDKSIPTLFVLKDIKDVWERFH